jgi:hypothetical protein
MNAEILMMNGNARVKMALKQKYPPAECMTLVTVIGVLASQLCLVVVQGSLSCCGQDFR